MDKNSEMDPSVVRGMFEQGVSIVTDRQTDSQSVSQSVSLFVNCLFSWVVSQPVNQSDKKSINITCSLSV